MKEVLIDGVIGYDWWSDSGVTRKTVEKQLEGITDNEEINIIINSPGGSVYEGIVIFNLIRDYAKTHPVSVRINCIAMSMGSYIALAARTVDKNAKVTASENSVVMIHNPWAFEIGDYRALKKTGDFLEKLAALYGSVHSAVSGKSEKEIRGAMDDETYYVGKEIQEIGFSNDFEIISQNDNEQGSAPGESSASGKRDTLIAKAQFEMERAKEKAQAAKTKDTAAYRGDFEKAVALFNVPKTPEAESEKPGEKNLGGLMTLAELKAQNPALYDEIFALGVQEGTNKEKARVSAHLLLGEKSGSLATAAKFIKEGVSVSDETAVAEYQAAKLDTIHLDARNKDNVGDVATGGEQGGGMDDAKLEAAFDNGVAGKDKGGKSWEE